jgi:hypothetical protein
MKKTFGLLGIAAMLCITAQAQVTQPIIPSGKIAVFKAGTGDGLWPMVTARCAPCFVQVFDPAISNQAAPLVSVAMSTNASVPGSVWINHHAGSEGGGLSRSVDRRYLAIEGYTGDILTPTSAKPSTDPTVHRGIVTLDAFTNAISVYSSLNSWFGIPVGAPSGTQDNPTGIASMDGTNFWGTGNFSGTSAELDGTLFYSPEVIGAPFEVQNYIQAAAEARVIGGTLYVAVPGSGIYNFVDPATGSVVPLPYDPDVPNSFQSTTFTNLFLSWGSKFANIANFDMNPAGTIAYGADQTYGIVKFTNNSGTWVQAPYYFNSTNLGTTAQAPANQGCFGICVDFSGTNPVIYASTMENGYPVVNTAAGHQNQNRLISIVDTGIDPGTNLVAVTLAVADTTNEFFGGIDFTPNLAPLISANPADYDTTNGGSATFAVGVNVAFPVTYQWLQDTNEVIDATNSTLTLTNLTTAADGYEYQCVVSDEYGSVTSAPALLTVTLNPTLPVITSGTNNVIGYVNSYTTFAGVTATGTEPFTYQWYFGTNALVDDGVTYVGSATASLTVSNLTTTNSGNYYVVVGNAAGYATNLVDDLTVDYHLAIIAAGQPQSVTTFVGTPTSITANESGATPPVTFQWYLGTTALSDTGDYSGTATPTLNIAATTTADSGTDYRVVVSNLGGSVTSSVATVSVIVPPNHSSVSYSNQVYSQTFDDLPDPGSAGVNKNGTAKGNGASVNSFNNPLYPGQLNGLAYSLANPFDFAYPVINNSYIGGLGLSTGSANLSGWYGAADTLYPGVGGLTRFGAQAGDQTTGGVIDFGPNDTENGIAGTNRALGLLSTGTTGSTTFGLKLINTSTNTLNAISLSFIGELWHNGTTARTMSFGYTIDSTASTFVLSAQSISNSTLVPGLTFSFPTAASVTTVDGTQSSNQVDLATNDLALSSPWQPNAALWLIWSINYYGSGSGNGYAIDNLIFSATNQVVLPPPSLPITILPTSTQIVGSGASAAFQFSFTNTSGLTFSVLATNNLTAPVATWPVIGQAVENPVGSGQYQFSDPNPATNDTEFYILRQP